MIFKPKLKLNINGIYVANDGEQVTIIDKREHFIGRKGVCEWNYHEDGGWNWGDISDKKHPFAIKRKL